MNRSIVFWNSELKKRESQDSLKKRRKRVSKESCEIEFATQEDAEYFLDFCNERGLEALYWPMSWPEKKAKPVCDECGTRKDVMATTSSFYHPPITISGCKEHFLTLLKKVITDFPSNNEHWNTTDYGWEEEYLTQFGYEKPKE